MDNTNWYNIQEFAPNTFQFNEAELWNMFLLIGEERAVSIDGGIGIGSVRELCESITSLPMEHILTHTHWDHLGSIHEWESISVHENGKNNLSNDFAEGCKDFISNWKGKEFPENFVSENFKLKPGIFGQPLYEGQIIDLGNRKLHIYETPGHSPDSISIYDEKEGVLITGDLVKPHMPLFIQVPTAVLSDYGPSLRRLESISKEKNVRWICSGHSEPFEDLSIIPEMADFVEKIEKGNIDPPQKIEAGKWGLVDEYRAERFQVWINDNARR